MSFLQFDECYGEAAASIGLSEGLHEKGKEIFQSAAHLMQYTEGVHPISDCKAGACLGLYMVQLMKNFFKMVFKEGNKALLKGLFCLLSPARQGMLVQAQFGVQICQPRFINIDESSLVLLRKPGCKEAF